MQFGLLLFLSLIFSITSSLLADGLFQQASSGNEGPLQKLRRKVSTKYRHVKSKLSNNNPRYQPSIATSDPAQKRLVNQANANNISHATDKNIYSTSSIAEDYCRDFGPASSVFLFAYRGSCYSLTNQAVTWSQADNLCQNHFQGSTDKNQGGLALLDDDMEFDYIRQIIGDFNRSATEFGAYIGFSYRNQSWLWLNGREVNFVETPPSVIAPNNLIFPYQQQKPCGKVELLRPNDTTILFGLMQQECTKVERALCKIKVDHCFENDQCGVHGVCTNDGTAFHCECTFLYDGIHCDTYSSEAMQVIAASIFIAIACLIICFCKRSQRYKSNRRRRQIQRRNEHSDDYVSNDASNCFLRSLSNTFARLYTSSTSSRPECKKSAIPPPLPNPRPNLAKAPKRHRPKPVMDGLLTFIQSFLTVSVAGIAIVYICVQRTSSIYGEPMEKSTKNHSTKPSLCQVIGTSNSNQNIVMLPLSFLLTLFLFIIHTSMHRDKKKSFLQNLSFPIIVNPFQKSNRFHTVIVFAIISNQMITLLYEILFSSDISFHHGILFDLVRRLGLIILYGARYFPILLSLNIPSFFSTFFTSIFLTFDLLLSVYFEANCVSTLTSLISLKSRTQVEITRIHYLLMKCLPHYVALGHIIARFYTLTLRNFLILCKGNSDRWNSASSSTYHTTSIEYDNDWYYTKNLLINKKRKSSPSNYYFYTQTSEEEGSCLNLIHLFYKPRAYFRFSLLVLFTYTVSFLVLYYLTCLVIFSSTFTLKVVMTLTGNVLIKLINLTNMNLSLKSFESVSFQREIYISSILSFCIYIIQLLLGLKKYQMDMLDYYRGKYEKKQRDSISSSCVLQRSFHYSGYQVGYLAYGFVIINYALFIICLIFKILFIHPLLVKIVLKVLAPLVILFALKQILVYCLTKYFFLRVVRSNRNLRQTVERQHRHQQDIYMERQDQAIYVDSSGSSVSTPDDDNYDEESHLFTLENRHAYFLFVYFNFFFDCFLGIFSCVLRLFKSSIALILYMPRLDYSIFGRSLEGIDNGYTAYASYIYVEAMHTHPILITFTQIIYMNILDKRRREKQFLSIDEKQILEQHRRKSLRFRWFLLVTLMNNVSLISTRRHYRRMTSNSGKIAPRTLSDSSLSNRTMTIDMCQ